MTAMWTAILNQSCFRLHPCLVQFRLDTLRGCEITSEWEAFEVVKRTNYLSFSFQVWIECDMSVWVANIEGVREKGY